MSSLRDTLLGTWHLIDIRIFQKGETKEVTDHMWKTTFGSLIYSPDGYMSVQLAASGDQPVSSAHQITAATGELIDAARNYVAYSGLFDVTDADPAGAVVLHTVQLASLPNMVGTVQRRLVSFEDGVEGRVLVLQVEDEAMGVERITVVRWTRAAK